MLHNLIYGLKNDKLVTIDEVDRGFSCNCICPNCKSKLIARKGNIREHHFAHLENEDCSWRGESLIHKKAKEIIANSKTIRLPKLLWTSDPDVVIFEETSISIDKVVLEKRIDNFIPDIIIESNRKKLLVEIVYSHDINYFKYAKIKQRNLPTIKIDVKHLVDSLYKKKDYFLENQKFQEQIISGTKYKSWVFNPELKKLKEILKIKYAERHIVRTIKSENYLHFDDFVYTEYCPINIRKWKSGIYKGESYASFYNDCEKCKYNLGADSYKIIGAKTKAHIATETAVYCVGHLGSAFDLDIIQVVNKHKKKITPR